MIHGFQEELDFSERASEDPFWYAIYRKAFPTMVNCMPCSGNTESQRDGIDRTILLSNGEILKIDEKKRRKMYNDFALEYISVDRTNAPGWMEKNLRIDFLAYAFMPKKLVYLLPWLMLKRAWEHHKVNWKAKYYKIEAENHNYKTISVAVPIAVVLSEVKNASIIQL